MHRVSVGSCTSRWSAIGRTLTAEAEQPKNQNLPMKEKQGQFVAATYLPLVGPTHQNTIGKEFLFLISSLAGFRLILR
jgi:hypothetical protein